MGMKGVNNYVVHIIAVVAWASFAISVGLEALATGQYTLWVALALITAIIANSWHLTSMEVSQGKIEIAATNTQENAREKGSPQMKQ